MKIAKELITIFRDDLCKDQREITIMHDTVGKSSTGKIMRKYNTSVEEYNNEIDVINFLISNGITGIPKIVGDGVEKDCHYLDMEYYDGIRVYNFFAYLREISAEYPELTDKCASLKSAIFKICLQRQKEIQKGLMLWAERNNKTEVYPQKKLLNIVKILSCVMQLDVDIDKLAQDVKYISDEFEKISVVPFRDSTTKNMVIYCPELYLGNFIDASCDVLKANSKRKEVILKTIKDDTYMHYAECAIIDFDFSSCEHLTSIYDDPIGFKCHEINWDGIPETSSLIWNTAVPPIEGKDIALSFIVRYLRFGGRKLAYHIFHPDAYIIRFAFDDENFYFDTLSEITRHFWKDADKYIPNFLKFIDLVSAFDKDKIIDDEDEFEEQYPNCNRKFYIDIFPF